MPAPFGSAFNDPEVQAALARLAELDMTALAEAQQPAPIAPHGSALNDPGVQSALANLAQIDAASLSQIDAAAISQAQGESAHGSGFNDPHVQRALAAFMEQTHAAPPPTLHVLKNALNGGELAPDILARHDLPRYQMGCEKLLNMIPLASGGITKRPGLSFVANAQGQNSQSRLIPFVYSASEQLMLHFLALDQGCLLFIIDRDGKGGQPLACSLPYSASDIGALSYVQCGKVVYLAHSKHKPAKLIWDGTTFTYEIVDFQNRTLIPSIASLEIVGVPNASWGWRHYCVTAVNEETGEESLPSEVMSLQTSPLNTGFMCQITINPVANANEYRVYKLRGGEYGFIGRVTDGSNIFRDQGYEPDTSDPPPKEQRFFANEGDYPSVVFLHQQRLGWAATDNDPLTLWLSQTSNFECLSYKTPPQDDDAIEATLASTQANRILWCMSDRSGLAIGTAGEEWYLTGASGEGSTLTPNSLAFQPQTRYGTEAGTEALRAGSSLLFIQRGGRMIRDLGYSFQTDRYEAQELTTLARHIFRFARVRDWAWQGSPANILWCVTDSGRLAGLTYMPEHEVVAWHRHETQGRIQCAATLDDSQGRSRLWLVCEREDNGEKECHVEILDEIFMGFPDAWDNCQHMQAMPEHLDGKARLPFRARAIPCLPQGQLENGSSAMRVKKINAVSVTVINSMPIACAVHSQNAASTKPLPLPCPGQTSHERLAQRHWTEQPAEWHCPIGAGFRDGARLELICDGPTPATILAVTASMEIASETGGQV